MNFAPSDHSTSIKSPLLEVKNLSRDFGGVASPCYGIEYAAQGLAKYKRLAKVVFTEMIPRSASGKVLRRLLKNSPSM